jgi:acyl-CoA thioester hydrolase
MPVQTYCHTHRVAYAECTLGNHVYYARYLDILEEARGEFFRSLGVPLLMLQKQDTGFPVIECHAKYRSAARYDDVVSVALWLTALDRVRLGFGYRITDQAGKLILEASTVHACTTLGEKPIRLPDCLEELLTPYLHGEPAGA